MNKTKTKLTTIMVSVIMALVCLITSIGAASSKAYADDNPPTKVYYFSDSAPTFDKDRIEYDFNVSVIVEIYDCQDDAQLSNKFDAILTQHSDAEVFIFEFKVFLPSGDVLESNFASYKDGNKKIFFISGFALGCYSSTGFIEYIYDSMLILSNNFEKYIGYSVKYMIECGFGEKSCIIIDKKFIDTDVEGIDIQYICAQCDFLRSLLEQIHSPLSTDLELVNYDDIRIELEDLNIYLLVQTGEAEFYDIISRENYNWSTNGVCTGIDEYFVANDINSFKLPDDTIIYKRFAMGWWPLEGCMQQLYSYRYTKKMLWNFWHLNDSDNGFGNGSGEFVDLIEKYDPDYNNDVYIDFCNKLGAVLAG